MNVVNSTLCYYTRSAGRWGDASSHAVSLPAAGSKARIIAIHHKAYWTTYQLG